MLSAIHEFTALIYQSFLSKKFILLRSQFYCHVPLRYETTAEISADEAAHLARL